MKALLCVMLVDGDAIADGAADAVGVPGVVDRLSWAELATILLVLRGEGVVVKDVNKVTSALDVTTGMEVNEVVEPAVIVPPELAGHCPGCAQYCPVGQHIDPHGLSPDPLSQINDVLAAGDVGRGKTGGGNGVVVGGGTIGCDGVVDGCKTGGGDRVVVGGETIGCAGAVGEPMCIAITSALPWIENLLGDASQQIFPPLSSGLLVSQQ